MNLCILFSILFTLVSTAHYFRLSTIGDNKFTVDDFLISTMGYFRVRLMQSTCQLRIEQFNEGEYKTKSFYPQQPFNYPCNSLTLTESSLLTQFSFPIIALKPSNKQLTPVIKQTVLTIDDMSVIRLTGTIDNQIRSQTIETKISMFRVPNKYLFATSNIFINENQTLNLVVNDGGWGFAARNGQFWIFNTDDTKKIFRYRYGVFEIKNGIIVDSQGLSPPSSDIQGMNYQPRCGRISYMNFKFPLLFVIDSHWPELRVLDQGGYELLSIRYPKYNCIFDLRINPIEGQSNCIDWFCPQGTFQYDGKCVLKCPLPYYHQIKPNKKNRCVLVCEEGSFQNEEERVCSCDEKFKKKKCPNGTEPYALGCFCTKQNSYYNGVSCTAECPLAFVQLSFTPAQSQRQIQSTTPSQLQNICIKCPYKCLKCAQQARKVASTLLICKQCQKGYILFQNVCKRQCNFPNDEIYYTSSNDTQGEAKIYSFNSSVKFGCWGDCTIQYCEFCSFGNDAYGAYGAYGISQFSETCLWCARPLILYKNMCIRKCPQKYIMKSTQDFHLYCQQIKTCQQIRQLTLSQKQQSAMQPYQKCQSCENLKQNRCWTDCNNFLYFNNLSKYFCLSAYDNENLKYQYGYYQLAAPALKQCPLTFYFYDLTAECLPCPFGCLTCIYDAWGTVECTSCSPSYFLMIDLNISHFCQRDSSLSTCSMTSYQRIYNPLTKICSYKTQHNTPPLASKFYSSISHRIKCRKNNPQCIICSIQSFTICTLCSDEYYLHQGQCVQECPSGTFKYQQSCIKGIQNCDHVEVKEKFYFVNVSQAMIGLDGYRLFIPFYYNTKEVFDPIGYMFFQSKAEQRIDTRMRITWFPYPYLQCGQCTNGLDLNPYSGRCQPCLQSVCLRCPNSVQNVCYQCIDDYKIDDSGKICVQKTLQERNCKSGQWRNQDMICVKECTGFELRDGGVINCTRYCNTNQQFNKIYRIIRQDQKLICIPSNAPSHTVSFLHSSLQLSSTTSILKLIPIEFKFNLNKVISLQQLNQIIISVITNKAVNGAIPIPRNKIQYLGFGRKDNSLIAVVDHNEEISVFGIQVPVGKFVIESEKVTLIRRQLQSSSSTQQQIYLSQSQYTLPATPPLLCIQNPIQVPICLLTIFYLILTILNLSSQISYKLDNIIILLQTLPLFFLSLNIQLVDLTYYQFLFAFKWTIGFVSGCDHFIYHDFGTRVLNGLTNGYVQSSSANAIAVVFGDGNAIRNCLGLGLVVGGIGIAVMIIGKCCLKDQSAVFWKRRKTDIEKQQAYQLKQSSAQNLLQITDQHPLKLNHQNKTPTLTKSYKQQQIYKKQDFILEQSDILSKQAMRSQRGLTNNIANSYSNTNMAKHRHKPRHKTNKRLPTTARQTKLQSTTNGQQVKHRITNSLPAQHQHQQPGTWVRSSILLSIKNSLRTLIWPGSQFHKYSPLDIDHYRKLKLLFIFIFESTTIVFVYFSLCTFMAHPMNMGHYGAARIASLIFAAFLLLLVFLYTSYSIRVDLIAGLYMVKRVLVSVVLVFVAGHSVNILLCIPIEIVFAVIRFLIEQYRFLPRPKKQPSSLANTNPNANANANTSLLVEVQQKQKDRKVSENKLNTDLTKNQLISTSCKPVSSVDKKQSIKSMLKQRRNSQEIKAKQINRPTRSPPKEKKSSKIKENRSQPKQPIQQKQKQKQKQKTQQQAKIQAKAQAQAKAQKPAEVRPPAPPALPAPPIPQPKFKHLFVYYRTIILIVQQLLIIIGYVLLCLTDTLVSSQNNTAQALKLDRIAQGLTGYHGYSNFGLLLIIIYFCALFVGWAIVFGVQIGDVFGQVWTDVRLTEVDKKKRASIEKVLKLNKYLKQHGQPAETIPKIHFEYLNEISYKVSYSQNYINQMQNQANNQNKTQNHKQDQKGEDVGKQRMNQGRGSYRSSYGKADSSGRYLERESKTRYRKVQKTSEKSKKEDFYNILKYQIGEYEYAYLY